MCVCFLKDADNQSLLMKKSVRSTLALAGQYGCFTHGECRNIMEKKQLLDLPPYNPTPMPMFMVFVPLTIPDDRIA
jgi:hypothetical protein